MVSVSLCEIPSFCEMLGGVCHRDTETLLINGTCPYSLIYYGSMTPRLWSVLRPTVFNVTSNALFCILQVWQDFIFDVVLRLLSCSTNFHSSKHIKTDWSIWDPLKGVNSRTCCLFNFQAELLVFVEEHFDFRPAWWGQLFSLSSGITKER